MSGPQYKGIKRKKAKGLYASRVDLDKTNRRLLTVLDREVAYLMMESHTAPLEEERSKALVAYCKLIRDLKAKEQEISSSASDEVLTSKIFLDSTTK
jgi:hypothetical protein